MTDRQHFFTAKDGETIVAVAMLCPPDHKKPSDMAYMKVGFGKCFLQGGIRNVAAWNEMEGKAGQPCHRLAGQVWYLNLLTVEMSPYHTLYPTPDSAHHPKC